MPAIKIFLGIDLVDPEKNSLCESYGNEIRIFIIVRIFMGYFRIQSFRVLYFIK